MRRFDMALVLAAVCLPASGALAQLDDDMIPAERSYATPEHGMVEFRVGPYQPDFGGTNTFDRFFDDDSGLLLQLELDVIAYRLEDVLYVTGGGIFGWAKYEGNTVDDDGVATDEETKLEIVPLTLLASLRFDMLPRQFRIPFIFTGKLGYQWMAWDTDSGTKDEANGWSLGLWWGVQVALDLDTFEPSAANTMDDEWNINHSYLFFEVFGFHPRDTSLPLGAISYTMGLGFVF